MSEQGVVFLRGAKTVLRPLDKKDAPMLQRWVNEPGVRKFLQRIFPVSLLEEEAWVESLQKQQKRIVLVIETLEGVPIGTMGLHSISWVDGTATTGALIGSKDFRGKGLGSDAKMSLLRWAFYDLGLRKICSSVYEFNKRSRAYLLRTGYVEEGRKRKQLFREGHYWDEILMAIFREDFHGRWLEHARETGLEPGCPSGEIVVVPR